MQNQGAVKFFAIALALVCLYQLSFTWFASRVDRDAVAYADAKVQGIQDEQQRDGLWNEAQRSYVDSMGPEVIYNFFWIRKYTYNECKEREINLGLDLKGGMNVILEVSVNDVLKSLSNFNTDPAFNQALAEAQKMAPSEDFVTRFGRAYAKIAPQGRLSAIFSTVDLREKIPFNASNEQVLEVLREQANGAVENSYNVIRNRIDRLGLAQPNIQRLEQSGRILVEMPGVKDPARIRKLLQGTASLEFWETYENKEVYPYLVMANNRIRDMRKLAGDTVAPIGSAARDSARALAGEQEPARETLGADTTSSAATAPTTEELLSEMQGKKQAAALGDSAQQDTASRQLVDELGNVGKSDSLLQDRIAFAREYPLFALLSPSQTQQGQLFPGPVVGLAHYRDTAAINAMLQDVKVKSLFPNGLRLMWTVKPVQNDQTGSIFQLVAIRASSRDGRPKLDGASIADARTDISQITGQSEVSMTMNAEGAKTWARLTAENIGKSVAIVLDDYVYSFPVVQTEIKGGKSQITGGFSISEAKDLVNVLQSGKLPAPARIIQEEIVGPSLGQKAIDSGLRSFAMSLVIILLFMVFYYGLRTGNMANFALLCNLFFIMGVLASFQATLTLPGIAGIVLTLGMAVDANVLIFERIKEELANGKGMANAVADGFKNALSAIIDGNLTTLLTAVILYAFGSGPIRGFATTLAIGILTSMFTAIFITRMLMLWFLKKNWKLAYDTPFSRGLFSNVNFRFVQSRKFSYLASGLVILAVVVSLSTRGLDQGIDFVGGRTYELRFTKPVETEQVAQLLGNVLGQQPQVKTYGERNQVRITTKYKIQEDGPEVDSEIDGLLYEGLRPILEPGVTQEQFLSDYKMSSTKVGPTIALDIRREAVVAVILSLLGIFLYILIRFRNWRFSAGALCGLAHNTLFVIGAYTLCWGLVPFNMEVDQSFIAAVLTIIGYTINDTVVIFDRIREYNALYPSQTPLDRINAALNSTLGRTFVTSLSTLVVLIPMLFFGGESIRGFIFALTVGIIVGPYSSLFIATPLAFDFGMKKQKAPVQKAGQARRPTI